VINKFKQMLGLSSKPPPLDTELIYIFFPEALQPLDRGDKYEDPLDAELSLSSLGYISGGGSSLSDEDDEGQRFVEACGVDVDTTDVSSALILLRHHLPVLGCLAGTELQYRIDDDPLLDRYDGTAWSIAEAREKMHPGFGI
jgi:hypothetical protein